MKYNKAFFALSRWCASMILGGLLVFGTFGASAQVVVNGNVFGGGNAADVTGNSTVLMQDNATVETDVYGGGALANVGTNNSNATTVTIEGGNVGGNVYGGGLGNAGTAALVNGVVTVNIGKDNGGSVSGEATIGGAVFGCNNVNGTPKDNVFVNIYKTARTNGVNTVSDNGFALSEVFGGGNKAAYLPATTGKVTTVHIYTCDNTIEYVYGGGNAADVGADSPGINASTDVIIDGGRFEWVFGGGNGAGAGNPGANVFGNVTVDYHAGEITYLFGGSNEKGNITGAKNVNLLADGSCTKHINSLYGGSNQADITGDVAITMACSANACPIDTVFGGSRNANISGNVTLTIEGGSYAEVFAGNNMGGTIGGNVTLNLLGGEMINAFGGNNAGGSVNGKITVNMLDKGGSCPLTVNNIYGGGKNAAYAPTTPGAYPEVNLINGSVTKKGDGTGGNVYGGGFGATATVTSTPTVNVGYDASMSSLASTLNGSTLTTSTVAVAGNVFGGGEAAPVSGSTTVALHQVTSGVTASTTVSGSVFGGGDVASVSGSTDVDINGGTVSQNVFGGGNLADVAGSTDVDVNGGTVTLDVYGGGALADVGTSSSDHTNVTIDGGTVGRGVYGGGLGDNSHEALVKGAVQVTVNSGSVNDVFGCNNVNGRPTSTVRVDINNNVGGDVFGGGNLATYTGDPYVYINKGTVSGNVFGGGNGDPDDATQTAGSVTGTPHVIVGDMSAGHESYQAIVSGDVYGGGNAAKVVTGTPTVSVPAKCNTQITNVYGGGNAADVPATSVTIDGGTISGMVFGGGHGDKDASPAIAANVTGNTNVTITGGTINQVFGGSNSNGTIGGTINVDINKANTSCPMVITEVYGGGNYAASNAGNLTIGCTGASSSEYIDYVYGGANRANITGDIVLNITGGRINHAFGGNNNSGVISGDITVNVEWTTPACSDQYLGDVYGGGNLAPHTGNPAVNIKNGTATNVFGGGKGATAIVTGNPVVTIGDDNASHVAVVSGNVYGGGDAAAVTGNTTVTYNDNNASSSVANLFGGGNAAGISGTTTVTLTSGKVTTGLYGGCNASGSVGDVTVALNGGTVGANGNPASVYGGGFGHSTSTTGDIAVTLGGSTVYGDIYGGSALGSVNGSSSNTTTVTLSSNGLNGSVFGGGMGSGSGSATQATTLGDVVINYNTANSGLTGIYGGANVNGDVAGDINVNIEANAGATGVGNSVDIYGGGLGQYTTTGGDVTVTVGNSSTPTLYGDLYGGSGYGEVGASGKLAKVDFKAGTLNGTIYGGGMGQGSPAISATVSGGTEVAVTSGTITGGIYGGCNERGNVVEDITVGITGGTVGANGSPASVFGGGYGANTTTGGDVLVNINGAGVTVWGDVYGGSGLGNVNGSASNTTTVNILNGEVKRDVFGGGLGSPSAAAQVAGVVTVNIGQDNGGGTYSGNATIGGNVYGCNNTNGSPQQEVTVNIYGTAHTAGVNTLTDAGYAIANVFGGGKNANYSVAGKVATVNVFGCDNTIGRVFGGGDAAAVTGTSVDLQGGRFEWVFGGGNGEVTAANVGTSGIDLAIHGGTIGTLVSGSNTQGTISGPINVNVDNNSGCTEVVTDFFGGSNQVDIATDVTTTIECGAGTFTNVYGGSNAANITGNVVLNLKGGTMQNVYGGSKGTNSVAANIDGNVTLNLYGGTISQDAFGGSNINGNITGDITVNVLDHEGTCDLNVHNIYGAGNLTPYTPTNASTTSPTINVMHVGQNDTIRGNVYGGGKGATAIVTANPRVNIGYDATTMNALATVEYPDATIDRNSKYVALIKGSVFGGGDAAAVTGSPIVTMDRFNSEASNLYGGGNNAGISGNAQVVMNEGRINAGIYGGCNTSGTVTGNATVDILGGTIGTVTEHARIFGGGFGQTTDVDGNVQVTFGNNAGTAEPTLYGDIYGGSALGNVNTNSAHFDSHNMNTVETTTIDILSGTVVGNVFGGGLGQRNGVNGATSDIAPIVYGKIQVNVGYEQAGNYYGNAVLRNASIYGCNNLNGTPQHDVFIDIYGTHRETSDLVSTTQGGTYAIAAVYGGGNQADYAPDYIYRKEMAVINAIANDSLRRPYVKKPHIYIHGCDNTIASLYGGGNAADVTGDSVVFDGGRYDEVFGGGNGVLVPANVGIGGVFLTGKGGFVGYIYEHCNKRGTITGNVTFIDGSGDPADCNHGVLKVQYHFCGGNEVDILGNFVHTYTCGTGEFGNLEYTALYGGCRLGTTYGNITLIIEGGQFGTIYGGPKGDPSLAANVKKFPASKAEMEADKLLPADERKYTDEMCTWMENHSSLYGTGGNVTIILRGGTIGDVYGGCDINGNVEGRITIIVDSTNTGCGLEINTIYGGGNLAPYNPDTAATDPNYAYPLIDLRNGHVNRYVFGGGKGSMASVNNGLVTSNPYVHMHPDVANGKSFLVKGDLFGGGELGQVHGNTKVAIEAGTVKGSVYGAGLGNIADEGFGLVTKNTWVDMQGGHVERSIYGGGELASVGTFTATYSAGESPLHIADEPKTCQTGTGVAKVTVGGNSMVGVLDKALMPPPVPEEDDYGYIFCGSRGDVDSVHHTNACKLAVVDSTYLEIGGNALVTSAVYGGCENGQVLRNTYVYITGECQIGVGHYNDGTDHFDTKYTAAQWSGENPAEFHEVSHWPYTSPYAIYDAWADETGYDSHGGSTSASNGHTFYGNVYGGGSGYYAIDPGTGVAPGTWRHSAGRVCGNTHVVIDGGHILNNVYGANEMTDVLGDATVEMSGGTLGVPRTVADILSRPLSGYLFGAGKGDPRILFNKMTKVQNVTVNVTGGRIFGSIFGGGEDGHVMGDVEVNVDLGTGKLGTTGTSYVDGNVFGGGRGFDGLAQTAGNVGGNITVNILSGNLLGSVYGGGRLGSVGTDLLFQNEANYGVMSSDPNRGNITVNITGGTIGNDDPADYNLSHSRGGNVFGGSMGRLTKLDGTLALNDWHKLGSAKSTTVNIDGRTNPVRIKGNVYGGSELGTVTENITVDIQGDVIVGRNAAGSTSHGNVYGGGVGHPELTAAQRAEVGNDATCDSIPTFAGLTGGTIQVNIHSGAINNNVYGGGELASVGTIATVTKHTDPNNSYYLSWPYEYTYSGTTGDARVTVTGGTIGFISGSDTTGGNIYGSARGTVGDRYVTGRLATARVTHVDINLTNPADKIIGDVYGSGENGHVYDSAVVTLRNGLVLGSVFGGGKGTDKYSTKLKNTSTDALYDADVYDIVAGKVFGNTYVNILGGRVEKNVYGGGNLASVGIGNYKDYGEGSNVSQADSLLAENSGHCYVTILGGTIGPGGLAHGTVDSISDYFVTTGHVFGAGKGIVFPAAEKVGFDYDRKYYVAYVNKTTVVIGDSTNPSSQYTNSDPHVTGNLFGGGENGHVRFDTYIQTNRGQIGLRPIGKSFHSDQYHWRYRGSIFGGGRGEDTNPDGSYCQSAGSVTRNTTIDIFGARIYRNVQGGGAMASVGPIKGRDGDSSTCVINIEFPSINDTIGGGSNNHKDFGGYISGGSRGIPSPDGTRNDSLATCHNSQINVRQGYIQNSVYGGSENGQILGNTQVNVYGGFIRSAIYGGGKGSYKADASEAGMPGTYNNDTLSGNVYGNTEVNLLGGTVPFTYGGCRRASVGGNATVNIGRNNGGTYEGNVKFQSSKRSVYGGNQYAGTPRGNIYVNVYKTAHNANDEVSGTQYAIKEVYGGSYNSNYEPNRTGSYAQVHIYGCDNTIDTVYGGGAAANIGAKPGIGADCKVIIDGGRFSAVFGGGNGYYDRATGTSVPADIYGTATTEIHGGTIGSLYGGSNFQGQADTIRISVNNDGSCGGTIEGDEFFGGSNLSNLGTALNPTVLSTTLGCGVNFRAAYGGSNQADIIGDVTFTIEGGEYGEVYAGSKGAVLDPSARQTQKDSAQADITGNTHLIIKGGTIHRAFGGSNINGNITGTITVDIDSTYNTCPWDVDYVYGGSNLTQYTPNATSTPTPLVNILCGTVDSNVFGGGKGTNTDFSAGLVTSNPKVTMSQTAKGNTWVKGDIYGGGEMASVGVFTRHANDSITASVADSGNTWVVITGGTVGPNSVSPTANDIKGHVFGGCLGKAGHVGNPGDPGYVNYANFAYVNTARVDISGTTHVRGSVFGGGENGHVFDSTLVNIEGGTVGNGIYRDEYAWLNPITGNVYGGGRGLDLSTNHTLNITAGWVRGATHVLVSGGHIHHNVYGGGSMASVGPRRNDVGYNNTYGLGDHNGRTWVEVTGGLIGICIDSTDRDQNYYGSVYGAGRGRSGVDIDYGNDWTGFTFVHNAKVIINYSNTALPNVSAETAYGTQHIVGNVFGGGFNGHVNNSTSVTITRGRIGSHGAMGYGSLEGNVFGGGCGEEPFKAYLVRDGYYITNAQLANGTGNTGIPYSKSDRSAVETYYSTPRSHNDSLAVTDSLSATAGLVYGDATVLINGATKNDVHVKHNVYGGGSMASVGDFWIYPATVGTGVDETETLGEVYPLTANKSGSPYNAPTNHAGSNTATGICTVTITGGTFGTNGINNGIIYGGCRGLEGNLMDIVNRMSYFNDAHVTLGTTSTLTDYNNPQILVNGSVFGGGENGHATGSTYVTIHDGKIGNRGSMYDRIKTLDDKNEDGTITAAEKREMDSLLVIASNCGNVYGGGCGTDKYHDRDTVVTRVIGGTLTNLKSVVDPTQDSVESVYRYNPYCGVVYGNTNVVIDGGYVEHNVYGGGSMANTGRWTGQVNPMITHTDPSNSFALSWPVEVTVRRGTGSANVAVSGNARIGYSGSDNGDIYGAARGEAGDRYEMARYANVHNATVTVDLPMPGGYDYTRTEKQIKNNVIKQYGTLVPLVAGSVYGGSENGQVSQNTSLTLTNGIVGHSLYGGGKGKGTYTSHHLKYKVADGVHAVGDDSTAVIYGLTAGKVFGNTAVTMAGGHVVRNIFGGGNLGSIGKGNYAGGVGDYREAGYGERWPDDNTGMRDSLTTSGNAVVTVTGGYVGTLGSSKDGLPTGNVFGGARGEAAPNDQTNPRYLYTPAYFLGYVNNTSVTIGASTGSNSTPQIYGSVYGGGQDGHVRGHAVVNINDGVIGCQYNSTNITLQGTNDKEAAMWKLRGNVFGAGSGLGQYTDKNGDLQYNAASGSVIDSTVVFINGGQVARNVYGGGSFATVGPPKVPPITDDPTYAQSHSRVIVSGGTVGYTPTNLADTTTFYGGSVFGAGRGIASDNYKGYCNVPHTYVSIASTVKGNVYGGGEDGHVVGNTNVNIATGATVGFGGTAFLQGSVFGGGQGSGAAIDHDSDTSTANEFRINKTCGRVGGNTSVTMTDGMIHGSIFGGGKLALTGVDADADYSTFVSTDLYDSINHGFATVTVTGGTIGTTDPADLLACDWSVGDIMGSGKGDIDKYEDIWAGRVANTSVTVSGSPVIRGSVFGGGEMASIGYWAETDGHPFVAQTGASHVAISGGTIGIDYEYTVDPNSNPGSWTIYDDNKDTLIHTITGNVFGGSQGDINVTAPHWVSMARSRQADVTISGTTVVKGNVYGGSEQGTVIGDTRVTINGGTFGYTGALGTGLTKVFTGDIYAAGYGSDNPADDSSGESNDSTYNRDVVLGLSSTPIVIAGRTYGDARVDVLGGTIHGSVYGGGSYASVGYELGSTKGNTFVNIGLPGADPTDKSQATGSATIEGEVFGANNFEGTPYGNTNVHIYKTAHTVTNACPANSDWAGLDGDDSELTRDDVLALDSTSANFALQAVYGGGNRAAHEPIEASGTTLVYIHYCDENTIKALYGGGNAADTRNNHTIIDGGRIYEVFGGGNGAGANNPGADVHGTAWTEVHGGLINDLFGGSNAKGMVDNTRLEVENTGSCNMMVANTYNGGNEAEGGGGVVNVGCGTKIGNFYGGARNADLTGDVILNITGGEFDNLFGGSRGTTARAANINGNVTVNVTGGHIHNLFGGSDVNGNITGQITVHVDLDPDYNCADGLLLEHVYGGSNLAIYTPDDTTLASPLVDIVNDSCANGKTFGIKSVYGGSVGNGTNLIDGVAAHGDTLTGYMKSNPMVNFGGSDYTLDFTNNALLIDGFVSPDPYRRNIAVVDSNIYGGGKAAPVEGNPTVLLYSSRISAINGSDTTFETRNHDTTLVRGSVYGAGFGPTAVVKGNTTVGIFGDATVIEGSVYGGGEAAILDGSTDVQVGYLRHFVCAQPFITIADDGTTDIYCATPGTAIYYTTDGSTPTTSSTRYTAPFNTPSGTTVKAMAVKTTNYNNAAGVSVANNGEVTLHSVVPFTRIYYLISNNANARFTYVDGVPTNGTLYDPANKPTLGAGQYIKAVAIGGLYQNSLPYMATRP